MFIAGSAGEPVRYQKGQSNTAPHTKSFAVPWPAAQPSSDKTAAAESQAGT